MLPTIVDYSATVAAWVVMLFRLGVVLKDRGRNTRVLKAWLFTLFFSLFGTFGLDTVYVSFDKLVGVNNASWLLSSLFLVLTIYFLCALCCSKPPRWMISYLILTAVLLVVLFPFGPAHDPDSVDQFVASSIPELLFVGSSYVFAIVVMSTIPTRAFIRAQGNEEDPAFRLRTIFLLLAVIAGITFFVTKLVIHLLGFTAVVPLSLLRRPAILASIPVLVACVLWPLGFASHQFYATLVRPIEFLHRVLILRELNALKTRLDRLCPAVLPIKATWQHKIKNLDLHIYWSVIGILDGKKTLAACLDGQKGELSPSDCLRWDGQRLEEVLFLHQALQSVPDSPSFEHLVNAYVGLGRRLRKWRE
jgi:hypothetical protein